jgi:L-ascorbate metabolism protein UlaG (beta-lactamase superfamily)
MKVTKYGQSCFLIESNNNKILIDPGNLKLTNDIINEWMNPTHIFITHRHADHIHLPSIEKIRNENTKIYSTSEVKKYNPEFEFNIIKENDEIQIDGFSVKAVHAIHGYLPPMKYNDAVIKENIGYLFEIEGKKIYHTSDTISFDNDVECDIIFVPVCGHGVVMDAFTASLFAKETKATMVIPCHYDNPKYPVDINDVKEKMKAQELNYKVLEVSESIEI